MKENREKQADFRRRMKEKGYRQKTIWYKPGEPPLPKLDAAEKEQVRDLLFYAQ